MKTGSRNKLLILIITLIATLTQIATDIYTPSLPAIAHHLQSSLGQVQLTMTCFLIGVAICNLIYGPLSEGIGRRYTLIIGILIAITGTILCIFAQHITLLLVGRFIQGCGLAAYSCLWRSIFRDSYDSDTMARVSGYLVTCITISVVISPLAGGFIQQYLGWRANFIILCCWMLLVLLCIFLFFEESSKHHGKHRLNMNFLITSYKELLTNRLFMTFSLMSFLCYGGLLAWLTAGPIILIHNAGVSPAEFGVLMILTGITTGVSGIIGGKISHRLALITIVKIGLGLMSLAGISLLISNYLLGINITAIMCSAILFVIGSTFIFMNCFALGFKNVGHIAGYAGSLYACIQLLGGVLFTSILGHLNTNSANPMAMMFLSSGILAFLAYKITTHKQSENNSAIKKQ